MPVEKITVQGFKEIQEKACDLEKQGKKVFVLFCGSKNEKGESWCPDCVKAEPVITSCLENLPENAVYVYCSVGGRDYWKDKSNEFRTQLKLTGVPTFLRWDQPQKKLVEEQLFSPDVINMMFEDDD